MRTMALVPFVGLFLLSTAQAEEPAFSFPLIQGYGGVAVMHNAAEPPRKDAKLVFDVTAESKPDQVNRGLESVARYLNLHAQAGHSPGDARLALVLHGGATRCALNDAAYGRVTSVPRNPNLPLIRELKKHGVEVYVCGQSLARNKFPTADVAPNLAIAVSAMTVNVNKQLDGHAYLAVP